MPRSHIGPPHSAAQGFARALIVLIVAGTAHEAAVAATQPAAPQTFDTTYAAPTGATIPVNAGGNLQTALNDARLGDTIVLQAGATFTGPFKLPNKTSGSGWIYVVSSRLASLPPAGKRVGPNDAPNMPKIVAPAHFSALTSVADSHHFRFVGIELAPAAGAYVYQVVAIGNKDTSPATLAHHIVFDRCYVHGDPVQSDRRGIEMDGAYVAVVDSYISDFKEVGADTQGLWAYNTTGPLKIVDNFIEAAGENVLFGGADSLAPSLLPSDIEIRGNYLFKPLTLMGGRYVVKNLLEFKAARRVLVTGNVLQNSPLGGQNGFALLITPRNQGGTAAWSGAYDIAVTDNTLINVGSGINISGLDNHYPTIMTTRILIRDNVIGVSGLGGANGRAFQVEDGGNNYTIDHNTLINTAPAGAGPDVLMADTAATKVANFTFTNNLATPTAYGFYGSVVGQGTAALNGQFSGWVFAKNVIAGARASLYPSGNFFPPSVAGIGFTDYSAGVFSLAPHSPYKAAGTDGLDIGANVGATGGAASSAVAPDPPGNFVVR